MSEETSDDPGWRIRREEKEENVKLFIARRFFGALDHRFFKSFPRRTNLAPQLQRRLRKKRKAWTFDIFGTQNSDGTYRTVTTGTWTREIYNEDGSWNPDFLNRWDSGKDSASPVCRRAHELFEQLQDPQKKLAALSSLQEEFQGLQPDESRIVLWLIACRKLSVEHATAFTQKEELFVNSAYYGRLELLQLCRKMRLVVGEKKESLKDAAAAMDKYRKHRTRCAQEVEKLGDLRRHTRSLPPSTAPDLRLIYTDMISLRAPERAKACREGHLYRGYCTQELLHECRLRHVSIDYDASAGQRRVHDDTDDDANKAALLQALSRADEHCMEHAPRHTKILEGLSKLELVKLCQGMALRQGDRSRETMIQHVKDFVQKQGRGRAGRHEEEDTIYVPVF